MNGRAYSEVYEILNLTSDDFKASIPEKFMNFIKSKRDVNYKPNFDANIPLENQKLMKKTKSILALLKLKYWCSEEEKKEFIKMLNENEKKHQKELSKAHNYDNIFKKKK